MDSKVREILFTPISAGNLTAMVHDFAIKVGGSVIKTPALLRCDGDKFEFTLHFSEHTPPANLGNLTKRFVTRKDQFTVAGQIEGEIAFRCRDVFPPGGCTTRSRGTSSLKLKSSRIELIPEGTDKLPSKKLRALLGIKDKPAVSEATSFTSHVIFHGPKHKVLDSGTETKRKNDFLGEAASSSADTHVFSGSGFEGALIQQGAELHLHLRSSPEGLMSNLSPVKLTKSVIQSVAFTFGFHPWPIYQEIRTDHRINERWISPHLNLKQSLLTATSDSLWSSYFSQRSNPLYSIIATIAEGLNRLTKSDHGRIETLLWHVRSSDLSRLPHSTKLLILCSALDGLMQVIAGCADKAKRDPTDKVWRKASDNLNLSWDRWTNEIFVLRAKHRHDLSHGRLWLLEDDFADDFDHYARLGCAFMTIIAARCGYEGPILANPFEPRKCIIRDIKEARRDS